MTSPFCVLQAKNITKTFETKDKITLLNNINFELQKAQTVAILGPSGVGKSTLLNIFGTLEAPSTGQLFIDEKPLHFYNLHQLRNQKIGFIFQSSNLLEHYTVLDNILMPSRIGRKPVGINSESYNKALFLLEQLGLYARKDFPAKYLSGGEKQRAALARALINDPSFLLADEPTGNLDQFNAEIVHELLIESAKKFNKALVVVTHNSELAKACDSKFVLKNCVLECIQ
jgi:lipoprotein-releasing system ATP-binding protein